VGDNHRRAALRARLGGANGFQPPLERAAIDELNPHLPCLGDCLLPELTWPMKSPLKRSSACARGVPFEVNTDPDEGIAPYVYGV